MLSLSEPSVAVKQILYFLSSLSHKCEVQALHPGFRVSKTWMTQGGKDDIPF